MWGSLVSSLSLNVNPKDSGRVKVVYSSTVYYTPELKTGVWCGVLLGIPNVVVVKSAGVIHVLESGL